MTARFKAYSPEPLYGGDYNKLRDFLIRLDSHNYHFGRWDWMISHGYLDKTGLDKIGLWEANGEIIAAATYDCKLGYAYILTAPDYRYLYQEMLIYAKGALSKDGGFRVLILNGDMEFQNIAAKNGFVATQERENDAVYPIGDWRQISYSLPEGFTVTSMADTFDLYKYGQVLWKGFNHEQNGEGAYVHEDTRNGDDGFNRPNVDLSLKIAVAAPNGDFVSYCGMWFDERSKSALVEPVATDPAYRKMGLGRAAVLEGVRRCGERGATRAFVGSSQQFYYAIGFMPFATSTWWEAK